MWKTGRDFLIEFKSRNGRTLSQRVGLTRDADFQDPEIIIKKARFWCAAHEVRFVGWTYFNRPEMTPVDEDAIAIEEAAGNPDNNGDGTMHRSVVGDLVDKVEDRIRKGDSPEAIAEEVARIAAHMSRIAERVASIDLKETPEVTAVTRR